MSDRPADLEDPQPRVADVQALDLLREQSRPISEQAVNLPELAMGRSKEDTQSTITDVAEKDLGRQLWAVRHATDGLTDSPYPVGPPDYGGPGGFGCAASVSEVLRESGVFREDEDPLSVPDVQTLLEDYHGWTRAYDSTNTPADQVVPLTDSSASPEPGDVLCAYYEDGGESAGGGINSHIGIVGDDGMVYAHEQAPDPDNPGQRHEVWTKGPLSVWNQTKFKGGIVALRASDEA